MSMRDATGLFGFDLGLGPFVGAAMAGGSPQRRQASSNSLAEKLKRAGVGLVTAELGRTPSGAAWVLTLEAPDQRVLTVSAALQPDQDPHSSETSSEVVARVLRYLGLT